MDSTFSALPIFLTPVVLTYVDTSIDDVGKHSAGPSGIEYPMIVLTEKHPIDPSMIGKSMHYISHNSIEVLPINRFSSIMTKSLVFILLRPLLTSFPY